jgi:lipid II:glycine glycyltransferase (peptidoglycan interpeptide bridge formation enzyme)
MSTTKLRPLAPGYSAEFDTVDEHSWCELVQEFDDGNIYQTGQYGTIVAGQNNVGRLVLRLDGGVVAIAQARIKKLPIFGFGIAYVHWGPLWRRPGEQINSDNFRQAVRALRNEYVCERNLTLRIFPILFEDDPLHVRSILAEEDLSPASESSQPRTILLDLAHPLTEIRQNMSAHCRRDLRTAERGNLEMIEGTSQEMFQIFIGMYKEMVSRKNFVEPNNIYQFMRIQSQLPEALKMRILLCKSETAFCSGLIYTSIGNSAIYLFGATSNAGLKSRGSYLLHWRAVEALKSQGASIYNLNGISPARNPGTYRFKSGFAGKFGRDVFYLGRFDVHPGSFGHLLIKFGDALRATARRMKQQAIEARTPKATAEV